MTRCLLFVTVLLSGLLFVVPSRAMRCESRLVREGDQSFIVKKICGTPVERELIGYTLTASRTRELKIENWVYGPMDGRYFILTFEGGVLKKIISVAAH